MFHLLHRQEGFALILSLLMVILLAVVILEANSRVRADLRAAGHFRDDHAAFYLARSAIFAGEARLREDIKNDLRRAERRDSLDESWAYPITGYPLGEGVLSGLITDEMGKININHLINAEGVAVPARASQLRRLFEYLGLSPDIVDAVVDYLDKNDEPLPFGAEDGYYRGLDPLYGAKNKGLDTLAELYMIRGITDALYKKISPYVTVYKGPSDGTPGKINVNTAEMVVLRSLDSGIDETEARRLIDQRPYKAPDVFRNRLPFEVRERMAVADSLQWIDIKSDFFSITAEVQVHDIRKIVHALVSRVAGRTDLLYFKVE